MTYLEAGPSLRLKGDHRGAHRHVGKLVCWAVWDDGEELGVDDVYPAENEGCADIALLTQRGRQIPYRIYMTYWQSIAPAESQP